MRGLPFGVFGIALVMIGCADPIIGDWEGEIENSTWDITFLEDGVGEAEASPNDRDGNVSFDVTWEADGDEYKVELDCKRSGIEGLPCDVFGYEGRYDCIIDAGGDLNCDPDDCDACEEIEFKKNE
jgi:hypothetical protein